MQVVENGFGTQVMYGEKRGAALGEQHKPFCGQESGLHSIIWTAGCTRAFFLFFCSLKNSSPL